MTEKTRPRPRRRRPAGKLKSERIQEALPRIEITVRQSTDAAFASAPEVDPVTVEIGRLPEER